MPARFANKVVLVTGAGSGIGWETAKRFVGEGARVALLARDRSDLEANRSRLGADADRALVVPADIAQPNEIREAVDRILATWGRLDVVFANAGINGVWAPIDELKVDEWQRTVRINLTGTFLTIKHCVPALRKQGGAIVITSSVNGTRMFSNSGATAYACTKAAQVAFAKMLALELADAKIRVNVVCPGWIETEIEESTEKRHLERAREPVEYPEGNVPLTDGAPGNAADVAEAVLFLCSDAARHITGTELWIDGGQSLLQG